MEYIREDQIRINNCDDCEANIRFRDNIKLAVSVAKRYMDPVDNSISFDDVMQVAYLGLWEACLRFDETKGFAFSTYAVNTIQGKVLHFLRETTLIKTPRYFKELHSRIHSLGYALPLGEDEIKVLLKEGYTHKQITDYLDFRVVSTENAITDDEYNIGDCISDERSTIIDYLSEEDIALVIDKMISYIEDKETHRRVVEDWLRSAAENTNINQTELGKKYGISQVQVSRIVKRAKRFFRLHENEIKDMLGIY